MAGWLIHRDWDILAHFCICICICILLLFEFELLFVFVFVFVFVFRMTQDYPLADSLGHADTCAAVAVVNLLGLCNENLASSTSEFLNFTSQLSEL